MRRRLLAAVLAAGCVAVPAARADGDPASDYLLSQDTFLPFDANISKEQAAQLNTVVADAKKQGFTIKVAVIAKQFDLGAVPSLYGKPKTYARFLGQELFFLYKGRLLIVMPKGYGASRGGKPLPSAQRVLDRMAAPQEGGAALTAAAARAVQRLAAQNGVRIEIPPVASGTSQTNDRIIIAGIAGGLVLLLLCGFAVRRILARR